MALLRWRDDVMDPFREVDRLREEINRLFDEGSPTTVRGLFDRTVAPPIDVIEESGGYRVICDVPGVKREDIQITMAQGVLTIKGEKKAAGKAGQERRYREETWHGEFQRSVALPTPVDTAKVSADLEDGVLTVALPKHVDALPKQIAVQAK